MVTTDHVTPSHILLSCLHTPARLSNEHCVDIYFNINIAAIILSTDPLFTYGSPYTLHLGGIYVVYFYRTIIWSIRKLNYAKIGKIFVLYSSGKLKFMDIN